MFFRFISDLRFVIGLFFAIVSTILILTGLFGESGTAPDGVNLNLCAGVAIFGFSAFMLALFAWSELKAPARDLAEKQAVTPEQKARKSLR